MGTGPGALWLNPPHDHSTLPPKVSWLHTPAPKEILPNHNTQHALKPSLPPLHGFLLGVIQQPVVPLAVE